MRVPRQRGVQRSLKLDDGVAVIRVNEPPLVADRGFHADELFNTTREFRYRIAPGKQLPHNRRETRPSGCLITQAPNFAEVGE